MTPPIIPHISKQDRDAVANQLATGYINDGGKVKELEEAISEYHGCFCVCMSSCTAALEVVVKYYGLGLVTIPKVSQISTAHACINAGSRCICADGPTLQVDLSGRKGDGGLIADSAQSLLTKGIIEGRQACCFSLGALKIISGGVGGGVLTSDIELWEYCKEVKNYGKARRAKNDSQIVRVGSNYRMSDINAALALSQWNRRDEIIKRKWHIYGEYKKRLGDVVWERKDGEVPWVVDADVVREGEAFRPYYRPFGSYHHLRNHIDNWRDALEHVRAVMLPSSETITDNEIAKHCETFKNEYL